MGAYLAKWEPIWEHISRNAHLGKWDYFPNGHFVSLVALSSETNSVAARGIAVRQVRSVFECPGAVDDG